LGAGTDEEGDDYYLVTYKTSEGEEKEMRFILLVGMTSFGGDKYEFFFEAEKIATTTAPATQPEEK